MNLRSRRWTTWRIGLAVAAVLAVLTLAPGTGHVQGLSLPWSGYAHDPHHTAISSAASAPLLRIRWQTPVDLAPPYIGGELFIHYGSPLVTTANTVVLPVRTSANDTFRMEAHKGNDGMLVWMHDTDYVLPPHSWIPTFSGVLVLQPGPLHWRVYYPGIGGTVYYIDNPDAVATVPKQIAFYGAHTADFDNKVFINTPITADRYGNIYFGYQVTNATATLGAKLKSGIARISYKGVGTWVNASAAAGNGITKVAHNCAPALSNDQRTLYVGVNATDGTSASGGYLLALNAATLATKSKVLLKDVNNPANEAYVHDDGTPTPTVGPDGDVYYGVLENPFGSNHLRGWLLHFSADLSVSKTPGAFGWDDTASVVPASMVPSYHGTSTYLLMTKYNNYVEGGGDGVNKVAVLDPNASMIDPVSGANVMQEVLTIAGPTADVPSKRDAAHPNAVREWCINTAAVDPATNSVLVNSEDGHMYRWDLTSNTLSENRPLAPPTGEAYTPTVIGVDGTVFAVNNAVLFAMGR